MDKLALLVTGTEEVHEILNLCNAPVREIPDLCDQPLHSVASCVHSESDSLYVSQVPHAPRRRCVP